GCYGLGFRCPPADCRPGKGTGHVTEEGTQGYYYHEEQKKTEEIEKNKPHDVAGAVRAPAAFGIHPMITSF
ncbi:MAG: hypothetical protein M1541_04225, partial [Acidobacteria bacterium]|nr:hypothetical protein [Acidobacteriota bacterium]